MSEPIKREDIRKGDRIRQVTEYTATHDFTKGPKKAASYELIERPVVLPTVPGSVIAGGGHVAIIGDDGHWRADDTIGSVTAEGIRNYFPEFTLLRPVAEVAAEVLAEVDARTQMFTGMGAQQAIAAIATKWANS